MDQKSCFIVSLDFELYWGVCESRPLSLYEENILGGRKAVPRLLSLFEKHGIHATWATVGFMFADGCEDAEKYFPSENLRPTYDNPRAFSYRCFEGIGKNEEEAPCFYAPSLIRMIAEHEGQEIGTHTFSHFYCRERGQTVAQFDADLRSALAIASDKGFDVRSLVLPRNQCEPDYTKAIADAGLLTYRGEESDWIHKKIKIRPLQRMLRLADVYLPLTGQGGYIPQKEAGVWNITGSRMYKPYFRPLKFLEPLKIRRIKKQMLHAAKNNLAFHLWWHPHNVGVKTDFHMKQLEEIFVYYEELRRKYGMVSMNMREAADYFSAED